MKILIAGATGIIGKRVVPLLIERGHEVIGLSRSAANDEQLARAGASSVRGDLFIRDEVTRAAAGCDAVLHLATAIPTTTPGDWSLNDRIRREGTANLVAAAVANHCTFYLQQSITFIYGDWGDAWVDERSPVDKHLAPHLLSAVDMESIVARAIEQHHLQAMTLRFALFYSADSALTQNTLRAISDGSYRVTGDGHHYTSSIHADDAASAVLAALEQREGHFGEIYNVADDDPPRQREYADTLAELLGAPRPAESDGRGISTRVSNRKISADLGWRPRYTHFREGFAAVIDEWQHRQT